MPRDEVREGLGRIAAVLRGAGDALQQQFGREASEVLNKALDDAQREIDRLFGDDPALAGHSAADDAA